MNVLFTNVVTHDQAESFDFNMSRQLENSSDVEGKNAPLIILLINFKIRSEIFIANQPIIHLVNDAKLACQTQCKRLDHSSL